MRRKSVRNSGKSSEKTKQPDTPLRKSKRNSKRRRKSTTSESENTEDEKDLSLGNRSEERIKTQTSEVENDDASEKVLSVKEDTLGKPPEVPSEKKIKLRRNKPTANQDEEDTSEKSSRRSRRRGSPKVEEATCREEAEEEDKEDKIGKGKSKGKHKSKIDKSQPQSESEKHTESEISENVQVTPQSPQTNIDNPVDKEPINVECETVVEKTQIEEECSEVNESVEESTAETNSLEETSTESVSEPQNQLQEDTEQTINQCSNKVDEENTSVTITPKCEDEDNAKGDEHIEEVSPSSPVHIPQDDLIEINTNKTEEVAVEEKTLEQVHEHKKDISNDDVHVEDNRNDDSFDLQKTKIIDSDDGKDNAIDQKFEKSENNSALILTCVEAVMDTTENQSHDDEGLKMLTINTPEIHLNENGNSKEGSIDQAHLMELEKCTKGEAVQETSELSTQQLKVDEKPKIQKQKIVISRDSCNHEMSEIVKRRKRWGNSAIGLDLISPTLMHLDINIIQALCPTIHLLEESEVKLEIASRDRRRSSHDQRERKKSERKVSLGDSDYPLYESQISENSTKSDDNLEQEIDNSNIIAMNRKISIVDDSASKLKPAPSPAKNSVSEVLYITNLVRPFTLKQLKELLERTGKIKENGFWTDRIKSKCYVQYESVNEAESTRNALHGVHWPIGNGKKLIIDYATPEDLDNARNPPPPIPPPPPPQPAVIPEVTRNDKENQEPPKKMKQEEEQKIREKEKEKRRHEHVREWDVGKEELHRGRSRSQDRHAHHKRRHSRNTPSPVDDFISRKNKKLEEQIPQKLMDDLFQKTKSTPSIYWQPLTPEEIATKQQQRLERMAEHKRRMEETSRNRADFGRGGPYRRRYD